MTDTTPGGFADTPGPEATPEQDADVRALLRFLRDEPLEMPADVRSRLDAVIAEERRTAAVAVAGGGPGSAGSAGGVGPLAPVTVLPTSRRGPSSRAFRIVGGLAAAALVVLGGVTVLRGTGAGSSSTSSSAASSAGGAADAASGTRVTASGTRYSQASLATQATALVASARAGGPALAQPAVPSPTTSSGTTYTTALTPAVAAACVRTLTEADGSTAVAVDSGSYGGQPAIVVVVPPPDAPGSLDVFVVKPGCGAGTADLLEFQRIPAS